MIRVVIEHDDNDFEDLLYCASHAIVALNLDFSWPINWKDHPVWMDLFMRWCADVDVLNYIVLMDLMGNRWSIMELWHHEFPCMKFSKRSTVMHLKFPSKSSISRRSSTFRSSFSVIRWFYALKSNVASVNRNVWLNCWSKSSVTNSRWIRFGTNSILSRTSIALFHRRTIFEEKSSSR